MSWSPLLTGEDAGEARREVARIARSLAAPAPQDSAFGPSLLAGHAGPALFFGYAHLEDPSRGYLELAEIWLERAIDRLAAEESPLSLYPGATGVAWVASHLAGLLGAEDDGEIAAEAVEAVLARVREQPWNGPIDLISGLAGYGVFLLTRTGSTATQALSEVVDRLAELARETPFGLTWTTEPDGTSGTGVAHGVSGILYVLAGAAAQGCNPEKAGRLLKGGVQGLFSLESPAPETRLSWCRGEAGISAVLAAIATPAWSSSWKRMAREAALHTARRDLAASGVEDPGLCHGAAGLGHLFNRLYQGYGDDRLAARSRFWLAEALRLRRLYPDSGGYPRLRQPPRDFLAGETGIGLALLAAISDVEPAWDQLLCASLPSPASEPWRAALQ